MRPPVSERTFTSAAIESLIAQLAPLWKSPNLATVFSNCLPNTLDTTVMYHTSDKDSVPDSFIITGDIPALWLRDSQNQLMAYLPYALDDPLLGQLIIGAIFRQAKSIHLDPYANSFNFNASTTTGQDHQGDVRQPPMVPAVFEGKYELDSLASFLKLSYWHYRYSGLAALKVFGTGNSWRGAVDAVLKTIELMTHVSGQEKDQPYLFGRETDVATDTLCMQGRHYPGNPQSGFSRQLFRPSDDAVSLPYNIPGNAMACVEMGHLLEMLAALGDETDDSESWTAAAATKARSVQASICGALKSVLAESLSQSKALPFEVDGYGSAVYMDDANCPSLLTLPLLGLVGTGNQAYQRTRKSILSPANPYFYSGQAGQGIGGPHVGPDMVWPMSIAYRGMTAETEQEASECLETLLTTTAGTGFMHESFDVNDATHFSRRWFAWVNGLFGEFVLQLVHTHPRLVLKDDDAAIALAQSIVKVPVSLQALRDAPQL